MFTYLLSVLVQIQIWFEQEKHFNSLRGSNTICLCQIVLLMQKELTLIVFDECIFKFYFRELKLVICGGIKYGYNWF